MNHSEHILQLLKKHTAQHPMRGDDLVKKLGIDPDTINDLLDDLQGRGALNRAKIIKDGETWTALWPTGLTPRNTSWKEDRDNSKGFSSLAAHNAQAAAEASRTEIKPIPTPALPLKGRESQETAMVRVTRPAEIVKAPAIPLHTQPDTHPINLTTNTGAVQRAILHALASGDWLDVASIYAGCDMKTTLGSVGKILETLAKRGVIEADIRFHAKRHRRFYRLADAGEASTQNSVGRMSAALSAECADPLCSELPKNLAKLRQIGADDHIADAGKMVEPSVFDAGRLGGGDIYARDDQPITRAAAVADLETDSTRFALWDNGALLITVGDEIIALPKPDVRRLANFLYGCDGAL